MMGMVRCNVPSVFVHGGSALPGQRPGPDGADLNVVDTYETIGKLLAGDATLDELDAVTRACLPSSGACAGQFTANTMGMVSEALGLAPIGSSMVPAVFSERAPLLRRAGKALMAAVMGDAPLPRDIVTRQALENACAVVSATGGSTNAALHIPAIAHEAGIPFHLDDVAAETSLFGRLSASGWHTCAMAMRMMCDDYLLDAASLGSPGIEQLKWLKPVYPGDTLGMRLTVLDSRLMSSRPQVGLVRSRWEVLNQQHEIVLSMEGWGMFRRRPTAEC
jgi:acyl dehydratase